MPFARSRSPLPTRRTAGGVPLPLRCGNQNENFKCSFILKSLTNNRPRLRPLQLLHAQLSNAGMEPSASRQWWNGFLARSRSSSSLEPCWWMGTGTIRPANENSSITQLVAGYTINDRFALQLNAPLIYREFKRRKIY